MWATTRLKFMKYQKGWDSGLKNLILALFLRLFRANIPAFRQLSGSGYYQCLALLPLPLS